MAKPSIAVWKFSSCDGCQLTFLDCEDELLLLADCINIAYFPEATRAVQPGPYDISFVEGSITTPEEAERIQQVRKNSKYLVTIGACATSGGIQTLKNFADVDDFVKSVYATPQYIDTLSTATPMKEHVEVDFEIRGCPISKKQLIEFIAATLSAKRPMISQESVCNECKRSGVPCVIVSQGKPCLGPVTQAGCDALCPKYNRGCFGCFGPKVGANTESLTSLLDQLGMSDRDKVRVFSTYNAWSPDFKLAADRIRQRGGYE